MDMKRLGIVVIAGALAVGAPRTPMACEWFGTQLDCDVAGGRVTIGTQTAIDPTYTGDIPLHPLGGDLRLPARLALHLPPLDVRLQNFGTDGSLCERIGNETYCH
jgi:hypothetical protein